jgi:hypothetical protein
MYHLPSGSQHTSKSALPVLQTQRRVCLGLPVFCEDSICHGDVYGDYCPLGCVDLLEEYSSAHKMEAADSSATSVTICQTTWRHIP